MPDSPPTRRRLLQFSLGTMLVLVALVAVGLIAYRALNPALVTVGSAEDGTTVSEVMRDAHLSILRLVQGQSRSSDHDPGVLILKALAQIGRARNATYCVVLRTWDDPADGSRMFFVGFTDVEDADIEQEFGRTWADDRGERREYMRVIDLETASTKWLEEPGFPFAVRGWEALVSEDDQQTIQNLEQAVERQPNVAHWWYNLGIAYAGVGRYNEAITAHARAVELAPGNPDLRKALDDWQAWLANPEGPFPGKPVSPDPTPVD